MTGVFGLCEQAVGLVRGKRLILSDKERRLLEALDYEGLTAEHAQDEAVVCALHFERVRDRLLQLYAWAFARKAAVVEAGGKLPDECMNVLCVMADGKPIDYEIIGGKLNTTTITEIHYTARITDISSWGMMFRDVFVYSLALEISPAVTGRADYVQVLEQKIQELIHRARQIGVIQTETRITLRQEIFNRAIGLSRGQRTVKPTSEVATTQGQDNAGISEWRPEAEINACLRSYESIRDRLLRGYAWKFAMTTATLAQKSEGTAGWKYTFALPSDCVKVWNVIAPDRISGCGNVELVEWESIGDELYANREIVHARYVKKVTALEELAAEFVEVYVCLLAVEVVMNVTGNASLSRMLEEKAAGLIQGAAMSGLIQERTGLPLQREGRRLKIGRPYLDYSGIPTGGRHEIYAGEFCGRRD